MPALSRYFFDSSEISESVNFCVMEAIKLCRLDTPIIFIEARINLSRFVVTGCAAKTTHAYSIVIGSKHITLNATGGGFLTASKQFRHGATSKSRSNTASNSTKHKSPHLSGWRQIISLIT